MQSQMHMHMHMHMLSYHLDVVSNLQAQRSRRESAGAAASSAARGPHGDAGVALSAFGQPQMMTSLCRSVHAATLPPCA